MHYELLAMYELVTRVFYFQGTQEEWQYIFYITAVVLIFGMVTFVIFGSGEVQDWAKDKARTGKEDQDSLLDHPNTQDITQFHFKQTDNRDEKIVERVSQV